MLDFCVCMKVVISEFNSEIVGSHMFCVLMLFPRFPVGVCMYHVSCLSEWCVCLGEE